MKRLIELDFLKFSLAVLVIFGHADVFLLTDYEYAKTTGHIYYILKRIVYEFHMPCFFIISGMLFAIKNGTYGGLWNIIKKKSVRLLVPMLFVGLFFDIPIRLLFAIRPYSVAQSLENLFIGNTYLWFLQALFMITIIAQILTRIKSDITRLFIVLSLYIISITLAFETPNVLYRTLHFTIYFYIGMSIMPFKDKIDEYIKNNFWISPFLCFLFFTLSIFQTFIPADSYVVFKKSLGLMPALVGSAFAYTVVLMLFQHKVLSRQLASTLSKNSFGLYLYGAPVRIPILSAAILLFGHQFLKSNLWLAVLIMVSFVMPCLISYVITISLRKLDVKYII